MGIYTSNSSVHHPVVNSTWLTMISDSTQVTADVPAAALALAQVDSALANVRLSFCQTH